MVSNLISYSGQYFIFPVPDFGFCNWAVWLEHFLVRTEAEKAEVLSNFFMSVVARSPVSLS